MNQGRIGEWNGGGNSATSPSGSWNSPRNSRENNEWSNNISNSPTWQSRGGGGGGGSGGSELKIDEWSADVGGGMGGGGGGGTSSFSNNTWQSQSSGSPPRDGHAAAAAAGWGKPSSGWESNRMDEPSTGGWSKNTDTDNSFNVNVGNWSTDDGSEPVNPVVAPVSSGGNWGSEAPISSTVGNWGDEPLPEGNSDSNW